MNNKELYVNYLEKVMIKEIGAKLLIIYGRKGTLEELFDREFLDDMYKTAALRYNVNGKNFHKEVYDILSKGIMEAQDMSLYVTMNDELTSENKKVVNTLLFDKRFFGFTSEEMINSFISEGSISINR